MREIKFKYKYTDGRNWITQVFTLAEICNGEPFEVLSDNPLLKDFKHVGQSQFIGLKNRVGKEIYEGDILTSFELIIEIIYLGNSFVGKYHGAQKDLWSPLESKNYLHWEKVGNIYENPELLT